MFNQNAQLENLSSVLSIKDHILRDVFVKLSVIPNITERLKRMSAFVEEYKDEDGVIIQIALVVWRKEIDYEQNIQNVAINTINEVVSFFNKYSLRIEMIQTMYNNGLCFVSAEDVGLDDGTILVEKDSYIEAPHIFFLFSLGGIYEILVKGHKTFKVD